MMETTSMGIIFVPFFIGVIALFYDARMVWAWILTWIGVAIIVIEIVSRLRFFYEMKSSSFILMIVMFAAGAGLMLRSYRELPGEEESDKSENGKPKGKSEAKSAEEEDSPV